MAQRATGGLGLRVAALGQRDVVIADVLRRRIADVGDRLAVTHELDLHGRVVSQTCLLELKRCFDLAESSAC